MCGRLVNLDTVARVLAEYYHLKTDTQLAALDEALSKVPAVSVGGSHEKDHVADPGKMVEDLISRRAAIDVLAEWHDEAITNRLNNLPSAQPVAKDINVPAKDCISRQWLMECVEEGWIKFDTEKDENKFVHLIRDIAPSAQSTMGQVNQGDTVNERAVKFLDLFAKTYCRDKSVTDDLKFRCSECEFEMPDKKCLVKCMARKLFPDYKDFGSMGDL